MSPYMVYPFSIHCLVLLFWLLSFQGPLFIPHLCLVGDDISLHTCVYSSTFWQKSLKEFHLSRKRKTSWTPSFAMLEMRVGRSWRDPAGFRPQVPDQESLLPPSQGSSTAVSWSFQSAGRRRGSESLSSACTRGWSQGSERGWEVCAGAGCSHSLHVSVSSVHPSLGLHTSCWIVFMSQSFLRQWSVHPCVFLHNAISLHLRIDTLTTVCSSYLPPYLWYWSYLLVIGYAINSLVFVLCSNNPS